MSFCVIFFLSAINFCDFVMFLKWILHILKCRTVLFIDEMNSYVRLFAVICYENVSCIREKCFWWLDSTQLRSTWKFRFRDSFLWDLRSVIFAISCSFWTPKSYIKVTLLDLNVFSQKFCPPPYAHAHAPNPPPSTLWNLKVVLKARKFAQGQWFASAF